jgi:hypothetical protein
MQSANPNAKRWRCQLYREFPVAVQRQLADSEASDKFGTYYFSVPTFDARNESAFRAFRTSRRKKKISAQLNHRPKRRIAMVVSNDRMEARARLWARGDEWRCDDVQWDGEVIPTDRPMP